MRFQIKQEETAIEILDSPENYSALKPLDKAQIVFRIWRYHSLSVCSSWLLYELEKTFFVRRLEWDRTKDNLYFGESEPTIYGSESEILSEQVKSIVDQLQLIRIQPFLVSDLVGIDGITYGIEAKLEHLKSQYSRERNFSPYFSWWSQPKESWQPLADWLGKTSDYFDSILPESTAKMTEANFRY